MNFKFTPEFLRSTPMKLFDLNLPRETAFEIVSHLGELSLLHFIDSCHDVALFSRKYANSIKRCEINLLKIDELNEIMKKFHKDLTKSKDIKSFLSEFRFFLKGRKITETSYFEEVESTIEEKYDQIQKQLKNLIDIGKKRDLLQEHKISLMKAKEFIKENKILNQQEMNIQMSENFEEKENSFGIKIHYLIGIILKEDLIRFKRIVFRTSKGNAVVFSEDLPMEENPIDWNTMTAKNMGFFVLMFRGSSLETLKEKILRILESFGVNYFEFPTSAEEFSSKVEEIQEKYQDLTETFKMTETHIDSLLNSLQKISIGCSLLEEYRLFLLKEKYIFTNLNYFYQDEGNIIKVKCYCPANQENMVREALSSIAKLESHEATGEFNFNPDIEKKYFPPPSHFKTNDFLYPFQEIVNTYGTPRYQEINPGLFTIITFPFMFGVMFGDIGHGLLVFSFGCFLCTFPNIIKVLKKIRYLIVLMGFFSFFCGLIYNEIFSIPLNLFGSCYQISGKAVSREHGCVYAFGMDPVWGVSSNELSFFNSFKMKMSVIIGVLHMLLGISIKGANSLKNQNSIDFFFEFLPQVLFMLATFFYLDLMIVIKWSINWDEERLSGPSLIQHFLDMALKLGDVEGTHLYGSGNMQVYVQRILFIIAIVSIPIMLVTKPALIYTIKNKKKNAHVDKKKKIIKRNSGLEIFQENEEEDHHEDEEKAFIPRNSQKELDNVLHKMRDYETNSEGSEFQHDHKEEQFGEIVVHQVIETIEFVLGSISNTASYLRLWALSLAHSQLSSVFFEKTVLKFVEERNVIGIIIGYLIFANVTFGVLMCMDSMECFLHALRLHWVEFQNKFFKGDGMKFEPLCFQEFLKNEIE